MKFHSGFVAIFGRPNTGKTTLLNKLCGQKIGIVTPKPQTTRSRIMGVITGKRSQMIFLDAPGYVAGALRHKLDERVQQCSVDTLKESEITLMLFDAARNSAQEDQEITKAAEQYGRKRLAVVNKIDLLNSEQLQPRLQQLAELTKISPQQILRISALNGLGIFGLLRSIRKLLPEGPLYYPADTLTDQSERFIAAELIREQIFLSTAQEVPYGCAVRIESYKEAKDGIRIQAEIIVERDSLKGMIVGQRGSKIKDIGIQARAAISHLTGLPVHLNLFVKVLKNWRKNEKAIKDFGY